MSVCFNILMDTSAMMSDVYCGLLLHIVLEVDWSGLIRQLRGVALAHSHLQHAKLGERDPIPWSFHEGKS